MRIWACQENGRKRGKKKPSPQREKEMPMGLKGRTAAFYFAYPIRATMPLREIAEFFAEQVQPADMLRVCVNADAQGDIVLPLQLQIRELNGGKLGVVQRASVFIHPPRLEQTVLRGSVAPPGGIEPAAPPAVIARGWSRRPARVRLRSQRWSLLKSSRYIGRVGGNLHREFQRFQLARARFRPAKSDIPADRIQTRASVR